MLNQTVAQVLSAADDSVTIINDINTNGSDSVYLMNGATQSQINEMIQRNVDHLETILAYDGENDTPNIVASSNSKKTSCSDAIKTGKAYIENNT